MSINDDDITSEPAPAGEGPADGGANPGGHDGGADGGSAGEGTADGGANPGGHDGGADGSRRRGPGRRRREPRRPRRRGRRLGVVTRRPGGARTGPPVRALALHRRADGASSPRALGPRAPARRRRHDGFADLFSAAAVDELVGRRGLRTPFVRLAHEGSVLRRPVHRPPAGSAPRSSDQVVQRQGARRVRRGRDDRAAGPAPHVAAAGRLHAASWSRSSATPRRSTRTSRRRRRRGSSPHYDTHDVFVLQVVRREALGHPRARAPRPAERPGVDGPPQTRSPTPAAASRVIDQVLRPGDALYLPRGWIHSATALGDTSIHLTVGMAAYTRADVVDTLLEPRRGHRGAARVAAARHRRVRPGPAAADRRGDRRRPGPRAHVDRRPARALRAAPRRPVRPRHPSRARRAAGHPRRDHRPDRGDARPVAAVAGRPGRDRGRPRPDHRPRHGAVPPGRGGAGDPCPARPATRSPSGPCPGSTWPARSSSSGGCCARVWW